MTSLADLVDATTNTVQALAQDPVMGLAVATAWLNPLHMEQADQDEYELAGFYGGWDAEDAAGVFRLALSIARDCFPKLYADLIKGMVCGWSYRDLSKTFCEGVKKRYPHIPLSTMYDITQGIPMEFMGMGWLTTEPEMPFPELVEIVQKLFWAQEYEPEDHEVLHDAGWPIAKALVRSLVAQDRQPYADLALLFLYLFEATGDTLIDMTYEDYAESGYDWMWWTPNNLVDMNWAYINQGVVRDASDRALILLETDEEIAEALRANIEIIRSATSAGVDAYERKDINDSLQWPNRVRTKCAARSYSRATGPDAGLLYIRAHYAERNRQGRH